MAANDEKEANFDPRRRLCPDGDCIGIIGSDGRCSVCGTADPDGHAPNPDQPEEHEADAAVEIADQDSSSNEGSASSGFDPKRRLCSDDACIGVIQADNRCSVCGRPGDGPAPG